MIIYTRTEEVRHMIKLIKKVLANRQARQAQVRRLENNRKNVNLIRQGLTERGY